MDTRHHPQQCRDCQMPLGELFARAEEIVRTRRIPDDLSDRWLPCTQCIRSVISVHNARVSSVPDQ